MDDWAPCQHRWQLLSSSVSDWSQLCHLVAGVDDGVDDGAGDDGGEGDEKWGLVPPSS